MLFNEFGSKEKPAVLLLHGMMQDWRSLYQLLNPLEEHYRLIIPAQDGFYDGSGDFTDFADQARQIEDFVQRGYEGNLHGAYGVSQGGLMLTELLTRNNISIGTAIMDGCYVAHQGRLSGWATYRMFRKYRNTGRFPMLIHLTMKLMGLKQDDLGMMKNLYMDASDESLKRNFMENYTYHARPEISKSDSMVHLWCGSKEPYALKSHRILKKHLKKHNEEVMADLSHGDFLLKHTDECCQKIHHALDGR
ncbi:MAG: alpha/beta hydrolase [Ruminococcaceae bacterium]|nr:alpha/beta hydrolase [Oscillospiraceae bacterium]